ncbi:LRFN2 [Branchiostoma lanceolatum]|uniref:LRFN2 protein n=1 Tax=Branchiostoma lanceolatum TaxID=7740 RepID=A0A8J9Z943_BRALA|nr:LRFN2 [Branchiostoma lanceolatum]
MKVSGLLLLVSLTRLWSGRTCLPATCRILPLAYLRTSLVSCYNISRSTIPDDIPTRAESLTVSNTCEIRNITTLPPLPMLRQLDLNRNCIEYFSWMSLRVLPNLKYLSLMANRLRHVKLGTVIEHLPLLTTVDLRSNKLASFSEYELGWPQVTEALINDNPFHCDCDLSWLIVKMTCLQACKGGDQQACCSSCSACFVAQSLKLSDHMHVCHSPRGLNTRNLYDVSTQLTGCGAHQSTTEPPGVSAPSAMFPTNETETKSQSQSNETPLSMILTSSSQTIVTSSLNTTGNTKQQEEDKKHPVLYLLVMGTFLALTVILCLIGVNFKYNLCCKCRKDVNTGAGPAHQLGRFYANRTYLNTPAGAVNHGHPPVNQTTQPIVNHIHSNPADGYDDGYLAVTDGRRSTALTTNRIYYIGERSDSENWTATNGTDTIAPTTNCIYSIGEGLNSGHWAATNGTETIAPKSSHMYSIGEGSHSGHWAATNGTDTIAPTTNCIYSIGEALSSGHGAFTDGTEITTQVTNNVYSIRGLNEEQLHRDSHATTAPSSLYTSPPVSSAEGMNHGTYCAS